MDSKLFSVKDIPMLMYHFRLDPEIVLGKDLPLWKKRQFYPTLSEGIHTLQVDLSKSLVEMIRKVYRPIFTFTLSLIYLSTI